MVNGSRYINGNKKDTPFYRRIGQRVLDTATNLDSGLSVTDSQSGFRAFNPDVRDVFRFGANGLAIESEMLADAAATGRFRRGLDLHLARLRVQPRRWHDVVGRQCQQGAPLRALDARRRGPGHAGARSGAHERAPLQI